MFEDIGKGRIETIGNGLLYLMQGKLGIKEAFQLVKE